MKSKIAFPFVKYLLFVVSLSVIASPGLAQNRVSVNQYKKPALDVKKAVEPSFGPGFASSTASHVRAQARLCLENDPSVEAIKAYDHLVEGVGPSGWVYGTQNCWLFVNVPKSLRDDVNNEDFYFFSGIGILQKDGLLPNPLIAHAMPGAVELSSAASSDRSVIALRLSSLQY